MKGLFLKDLALLKNQIRQVLIVMLVAVFMMFFNEDITFPIMYCVMVFAILGIGSISYDAFDNGNAFLFTLPITRKQYALEKYLFMLTLLLSGCVVACGIIIFHAMKTGVAITSSGNFEYLIGCACGIVIFMAAILPIELKYGPEKGRIAMVAFFAVMVALAFLLKGVAEKIDFTPIFEVLSNTTPKMVLGILAGVSILLLSISCGISCRIIEKKEF